MTEQQAYEVVDRRAGLINGANRSRRRIAMTPVTQQEADPEKIAMTAPVVQQATGRPGSYLVQFVMPSHFTAQTLRKEFEERGKALRRAIVAAGLHPAGPVRYARFNPPWTPWILRRNEVVQTVEE